MSVLRFEQVTVTASMNGRKAEVLRDISFALGQGEIVGLVGESGAGKSMIGRTISGLLPENFKVTQGPAFRCADNRNPEKSRSSIRRRFDFGPFWPFSPGRPQPNTLGQRCHVTQANSPPAC